MAGQTEQVLSAIMDDIEGGRINPGDVIEESRLVEVHGVSRTPVREALIHLEAKGLVRRLPRKGAVLFKPSLEEFLALLEVHASLEGQAANLAAHRLTVPNAVKLEAVVCACEAHCKASGEDDPIGYSRLDHRFHEAVAASTGNPFLVEMIKVNARMLTAYFRARYRLPGAISTSASDHRRIAALITERERDQAEAAMIAHVRFDQVTVMDMLAARP